MPLRAPRPEEAEAIAAVVAARDIVDLGRPDHTLEDLQDEWRAVDFDLTTDAVVAELDDGRIAGYATIRRGGVLASVHPEYEGRAIGTQLLDWAERRARELGRTHHRQWVGARDERGRKLLTGAGYRHVRSYYRMVRGLDGLYGLVMPPTAATLRRPDLVGDAERLHALDAASFAAVPDYVPSSISQLRDEHLGAHDADAELSNVAVQGDAIVGFLLTCRLVEENAGFIDLLMVHPDHQRRGLGTALLLTAFREYEAAGLSEAQLGVASDNPVAVRLYERHGMRPRFQLDTYERAAEA